MTAAPITIVSGLPRSGTSVMMQMLVAGGIPPLTDEVRRADVDNPRGYYEYERAKKIKTDKAWLPEAEGKVVKMVHLLLLDLPMAGPEGEGRRYDIVFMRRDSREVVRSQSTMLARLGKPGGQIPEQTLIQTYQQQIDRVLGFVRSHANARLVEVSYNDLMRDPASAAARLVEFLGRPMNVAAMVAAVDPTLYRNRGT